MIKRLTDYTTVAEDVNKNVIKVYAFRREIKVYLTIITTALVLTQIIRVTQNALQLHRQNKLIKAQLGQISDVTDEDLRMQRETYKLLHDYLMQKYEEESGMDNQKINDIIKSLHGCRKGSCENCIYNVPDNNYTTCVDNLIKDAADALERILSAERTKNDN